MAFTTARMSVERPPCGHRPSSASTRAHSASVMSPRWPSGPRAASRRRAFSRTSAALKQAPATQIGLPGYVWQTAQDGAVRKFHKEMAGQFVAWDSPPTLEGLATHAGRC